MQRKSMSERVLERRSKRILNRAEWGAKIFLFLILASSAVFAAYHLKHKDAVVTASVWQGFSMTGVGSKGTWYESAADKNSDGIPNVLYVADQRWEIVEVNHFSDAVDKDGEPRSDTFKGAQAETNCEHRIISYIETDDPRSLRTNLMHEIFHAGRCLHKEGDAWWNSAEIPKDDVDHLGVYRLGEFMYNFSHDNPEFMQWETQ